MENIARYIIRASFSQERMKYLSEASKVIYKSKSGNNTKEFDAVDFIAGLSSHIPNKNEQMVSIWVTTAMCAGAEGKNRVLVNLTVS